MERILIAYSNNKLKLENSEGQNDEFSRTGLIIPVALKGFTVHEKYRLSESDETSIISSIRCREAEPDLYEFVRDYEESSESEDYDLSDEIKHELKILTDRTNIARIKTDSYSFGGVINLKEHGETNSVTLKNYGFFTSVTINFFLPIGIFNELIDASRKGQLQSIDIDIEISGFNLGHKLGKGMSGVLIENEESFKLNSLSTSLRNPQQEILSAIVRLNRKIYELTDHDAE